MDMWLLCKIIYVASNGMYMEHQADTEICTRSPQISSAEEKC
jgi:hypothetical protein